MNKKIWRILTMSTAVFFGLAAGGDANSSPNESTYQTVTRIDDWGASIPKVIVALGREVNKKEIAKDTFSVYVKRSIANATVDKKIMSETEGFREVTNAYVADADGNSVDAGHYVVIELRVGPTVLLGSPLNFDVQTMRNDWVSCDYKITQKKEINSKFGKIDNMVITRFAGNINPDTAMFSYAAEKNDDIVMHYASFAPSDTKKHPLIIWLHGIGEGGTDPTIPISGNKADVFAHDDWQNEFGGAYVLIPQAPTFWMDGFKSEGDGTSKYEKSLMQLIQNYVKKHKNIDMDRIYIGGDSNGGYMTMLLVRDYPEYFAAAFPTCEVLKDQLITEKDIQTMKNMPIWFTAAKTDQAVLPSEYVVPTYQRLIDAGAKNIHFSFLDRVSDQTGLYMKEDGITPFEYNGHFSWIYVYNNQCESTLDNKTIKLRQWLVMQKKK